MPFKIRFIHQLSLIVSLSVIVLAAVTTLVFTEVSSRAMRAYILEGGLKLAENLANQSTLAILYESRETAAEVAGSFMAYPDVAGVDIYTSAGAEVFHAGESVALDHLSLAKADAVSLYKEDDDYWFFISPVLSGGQATEQPETLDSMHANFESETLGYVGLVIGKNTLIKLTEDILVYNLLVLSCVATALLFVILVLTHRLTSPISYLANTMRKAGLGERKLRANMPGPKDIEEMQQAFNAMMETLENREIALESARDRAMELAREKSQFASVVSHELRTPLNGILGMLELMSENDSQQDRSYLEIATHSAQSLLSLVNNVLDFSKNEADKTLIEYQSFNLDAELSELVMLLSIQVNKKGIDLVYRIDAGVPEQLVGDHHRLRQVIMNLLGNAIKFTEQGLVGISVQALRVEEASSDVTLQFEVYDTGIGIPEGKLKDIFEAFSQVDATTTRKFGGTGLGLAISRQLVTLMGGEMYVDSVQGEGSRFYFTVPFKVQLTDTSVTPKLGVTGKKALLVQMNDELIASFSTFVSSGDWTITATNLNGLMVRLANETLDEDLIVVDVAAVAHTQVGPVEAVKRLKARYAGKVVVLASDFSRARQLKAVADAFIEKPMIRTRVVERINRAFNVTSIQPSAAVAKPDVASFAQYKVLLIEDNIVNQQVAAAMFKRFNCRLDIAEHGAIGLQMLEAKDYDLILTDCHMPVMDGYEAARAIRARTDAKARIPIVAITANTAPGEKEQCQAAGMNDYLSKPITNEALANVLKKWLHGKVARPVEAASSAAPEENDPNLSLTLEATRATAKTQIDNIGFNRPTADSPLDDQSINQKKLAELEEVMGANFSSLVEGLIASLPQYLDLLEAAIEVRKADEILSLAHTIKGSVSNFGADGLMNSCERLESIAEGANWADISGQVASIRQQATAFLVALERHRTQSR